MADVTISQDKMKVGALVLVLLCGIGGAYYFGQKQGERVIPGDTCGCGAACKCGVTPLLRRLRRDGDTGVVLEPTTKEQHP
jgi:hypothetical protein